MSDERPSCATDLQEFLKQMPFARELNLVIVEAKRGTVRVRLRPEKRLFNHFGSYQAGVLFSLSEITGGVLCGTYLDLNKTFLITRSGEIRFENVSDGELLSEAFLSEEAMVKALAELNARKKTELEIDVVVKDEGGQIITRGRNSYYLRARMPRSVSLK